VGGRQLDALGYLQMFVYEALEFDIRLPYVFKSQTDSEVWV
jgi:hypothetical protein